MGYAHLSTHPVVNVIIFLIIILFPPYPKPTETGVTGWAFFLHIFFQVSVQGFEGDCDVSYQIKLKTSTTYITATNRTWMSELELD